MKPAVNVPTSQRGLAMWSPQRHNRQMGQKITVNKTKEYQVFHVIVSLSTLAPSFFHLFLCHFLLPLSLSFSHSVSCVRQLSLSDTFRGGKSFYLLFFLTLFSLISFSVSFFLCSLHRALSGVICVGSHCLDNRLYRIMRERVGGG